MAASTLRAASWRTALHVACESGNVEAARLLIEYDAKRNKADDDGKSPLYRACRWGDVASLFLANGAKVNQALKNGWSPLYVACGMGHVDVARLLLNRGARIDQGAHDDTTPSRSAAPTRRWPRVCPSSFLFLQQ